MNPIPSKSELTTLEEGYDLYPGSKLPRHERDIGELIDAPRNPAPDEFLAVTPRCAPSAVDPRMCGCERVNPCPHGHCARHTIPLAHFEDHVGDPRDDECDFGLDVAYGFDTESKIRKVFVDQGKDGLVGDPIAGVTRCGSDEPGIDEVEGGVDVCAEGWGDRFWVWFGGGCGCCESVLPVFEHGGRGGGIR